MRISRTVVALALTAAVSVPALLPATAASAATPSPAQCAALNARVVGAVIALATAQASGAPQEEIVRLTLAVSITKAAKALAGC